MIETSCTMRRAATGPPVTEIRVGSGAHAAPLQGSERRRQGVSHGDDRCPLRPERRRYENFVLTAGAVLSRNEIAVVSMAGEGAACRLDGAYLAAAGSMPTTRPRSSMPSRRRPAPRSTRACSTIRRAAFSRAASSCEKDAQKADGHQLNKISCCRTARRSTPSRNSRSSPTT